MTHRCHWPGCDQEVEPKLWGCRRHWFALPPAFRARIWREYRPGQEVDKKPSPGYLAVAREVQEWIKAGRPGGAGNNRVLDEARAVDPIAGMTPGAQIDNATKYFKNCPACGASLLMGQVQDVYRAIRWRAFDATPTEHAGRRFYSQHKCEDKT